jgi:seryl-tRNA synthetase
MIDIRIIRENPELIRKSCERRNVDAKIVDDVAALDSGYREILKNVESLRAERNRLSAECKANPEARVTVKKIKETLSEQEAKLAEVDTKLRDRMSWLPNLLSDDVPDGKSDADNREIRKVGEIRNYSFKPRDHQELGERLGVIDTEKGARVAQSGFYYWKGRGAELCSALFFWAQKVLVSKGFTSFFTPCVAKPQTLYGTGYLPFFENQIYKIKDEELALIGTSEQTLVGYHSDETMASSELPLLYTAFTPCFRTEAGSYGKASRGIFRVHQFHKVEQIVFCMPEESEKYHQLCLENEEYMLKALNIPYRVVDVCVGDMGAPGYRKYDIEAWFPGFGGYREVTSNTNLTDFQSRRLNVRYRKDGGEKGFVHTISATAVTDRFVIAILENFQREDGSVLVPDVLVPFTGFDIIK